VTVVEETRLTDPSGRGVTTAPDWVPVDFCWAKGEGVVDWCDMGGRRFTDPFFVQTLQSCHLDGRRGRRSGADALLAGATSAPLALSGLIFHLSRCGSTLVTQMLARDPRNVVVAEPPLLDGILRSGQDVPGASSEERVAWLRGAVRALGRRRHLDEGHLVVKFESWHAAELPLVRRAFPGVPWLFLVREPVEVLQSLYEDPPGALFPGALPTGPLGLDVTAAASMDLSTYQARVLAWAAEEAAGQVDDSALVLDYRQLPEALGAVCDHFGLSPDEPTRRAMRSVAAYDAKRPDAEFRPDGERKRRQASPSVRQAAELLRPAVERLRALSSAPAEGGLR